MADEKLDTEEAVALTMLADVVADKPEAVKRVLEKHGEVATGDAEIDFLKILALTEERGRFFTEDFEEMAAGECKYFGTGLALAVAGKLGSKLGTKITEKIAERREKRDGEPGKIKKLLQKVFSKKEDGSSKTPTEISEDENAKIIAGDKPTGDDKDGDKPKPKPILGMHPALFFSIVAIIIIVIIILIIRAMSKKKKKQGEGEKK